MLRRYRVCIASFFYPILLAACGSGGGVYSTSSGGSGGDGVGKPITLSGTISYESVPAVYDEARNKGSLDFFRTTIKPVRNAVVEVVEGSTVLATTTTDESGEYVITYTPQGGSQPALVVLAETLAPSIEIQDNTDENAVWGLVSTIDGMSSTKNLVATSGWTGWSYDNDNRRAAPFAVLDSMYTAAKAFTPVRSVSFPPLQVRWSPDNVPQSGDKAEGFIGTSHFSPSENAIYILGKDGVDTDEFDSHVIAHEWAHFFQTNLSRSDSPGGEHSLGESVDPTLSFGEGSATAIAAMVLNDPLYVDTSWHGGIMDAFAQNAESVPAETDDPNPGVLSEITNTRILYDIFDSGTVESYDRMSFGLGTLYDVLVGPLKTTDALVTLANYICGLRQQPGVDPAALDSILSHFQVGAITTSWGDGDSTLRQMYADVSAFPSTLTRNLIGGYRYNEYQQKQFYVITGNGRPVTVSATSAEDVGIAVYEAGNLLQSADSYLSGSETLIFPTAPNRKYVLVLTGFSELAGSYEVTMRFTTS